MALAGFRVLDRPFGIWPATLQMMPEGILDASFGKLFVGIRVSNISGVAWPATEVRISTRGRRILAAAKIAISDGWAVADGAIIGQTNTTEWVPLAALAPFTSPGAPVQLAFFKLDVTNATIGLHVVELELRDPAAPQATLKTTTIVSVSRTTC